MLSAVRDARPDVVAGDLNATLDHAPLRALEDAGYRDVAESTDAGWQPTWPTNGFFEVLGIPVPPAVAIDHVLVREDLAGVSARTVAIDGSDHAMLVAEVAHR